MATIIGKPSHVTYRDSDDKEKDRRREEEDNRYIQQDSFNDASDRKEVSPSEDSISAKSKRNLHNCIPQLRQEHSRIYGMDCSFSVVANDKESEVIHSPICVSAVSSVQECVKTHLRTSSTNRANVHTILGHDMLCAIAINQVEFCFAMASVLQVLYRNICMW